MEMRNKMYLSPEIKEVKIVNEGVFGTSTQTDPGYLDIPSGTGYSEVEW